MTQVEPEPIKHYDYDFDKVHEMVERKDMDILQDLGGLEGLAQAWDIDLRNGLDRATLDKRRAQWGMNEMDKKEPVQFLDLLIEAFQDKIIILLCCAAVISLIFGLTLQNPHTGEVERATGWIEGVAIILTVALVTLTGSIQNYDKAKKFEEMEEENSAKSITVWRNGEESIVPTKDLVPGDVVVLEGGIQFDVDGILIDGTNLVTNEAAMTGESDLVKKRVQPGFEWFSPQPTAHSSPTNKRAGGKTYDEVVPMTNDDTSSTEKPKGDANGDDAEKTPKPADSEAKTNDTDKPNTTSDEPAAATGVTEVPADKADINGDAQEGESLSHSATEGAQTEVVKPKQHGKSDQFLLSGTLLEDGAGTMLVIATGMQSFQGVLKKETGGDSGQTPLEEHLEDLADKIGYAGFAAAAVLIVALCIKEAILIGEDGKEANATNFLNFLIIAVTLIVVAIPEGLPLAVTISLAFSMKAMMKDNCLVRVLASCETMGGATAICSDKTGTLTTNIMTVVQGLINEEEFIFGGFACAARDESVPAYDRVDPKFTTTDDNMEKFCFALAINSTAKEQKVDGVMQWTGNKTEHGLLGFVKDRCHKDYMKIRKEIHIDNKKQFPFNSSKKRMTTIVRDNSGLMTAYCKGASEIILDDCDQYVDKDGALVSMSPQKKAHFETVIKSMASQGNRTIGIAFCPCHFTEFPEEEPSMSMVFMGVMGIQDPIREEVPDAVLKCQSAGLVIRMVTGDNIDTAIAISKKANIYSDNGFDLAMEGKDLRAWHKRAEKDPEEMKALLAEIPRIRILARSSPTDKHILVGLLQDIGEVVGVTGDGTNDAPALKLANVGFAMFTGTDIAKGAADMILIDDNFASVVNAIRWGRAVNDNIRKFLQFQLSINAGGVFLTLVGSIASETSKEPFTPVQMLWLNLIMDTMAALALATETPEDSCLKRAPVYKQAPLIGNKMRGFIGIHSGFQTVIILLILFGGHIWFDTVEDPANCRDIPNNGLETVSVTTGSGSSAMSSMVTQNTARQQACVEMCTDHGGVIKDGNVCLQGMIHSTIIFNTFIWMQIFNIFNARKLYDEINPFEGIYPRSMMLIKVFGIILITQVIAVEVFGPYLQFMETTHLTWYYWLICVGFGILELPLGFVPRLLPITDFIPASVVEKHEREDKLRAELTTKSKK